MTAAARDIALPRPSRIWDCQVAPDGARLAWVAQRIDDRNEDEEMYDVWVSDLDGAVLADLGSVPGSWVRFPGDPAGDRYDWPQYLAWVPGGKALSFTYRGAIWTVPAERPQPLAGGAA